MVVSRILAASLTVICCCLCAESASSAEAVSPVPVVADAEIANPRQPQAAVDDRGAIFVAFGAGDAVYCAASSDGGKNFASPVKVAAVGKLALGRRRGPRIAAGQGFVVISAISHEAGNVLSWRSTDGGKSWQGPVEVNDSPRQAREGLHDMAIGLRGELYCTWLDLRSGKTEIYGASSTDGGRSWSDNRRIYTSPSGSVCECCHPSVSFDSAGSVHVMWRNSVDGARDMYAAVSHDGGATFSAAEKLGIGTWKLDACPMDGGSLAATAAGQITTVWRRDRQLYRTRSDQRFEEPLGTGEQPWAAATSSGVWLAWISRRGGDLWLLPEDAADAVKLAGNAQDPMLATAVAGNGPLIAVWEAVSGENTTIMSAIVSQP